MLIVGCDFHTRYQQIAMLDRESGELVERQLEHGNGEARAFYAGLPKPARIGMEATGHAQWFERMLAEQGHELWIGDAARIRAGAVRKQKTDKLDAAHLLKLLLEERFPRIWIPSPGERDLRQLLRHRYKLVCFRTSVKNQLHALAMSQGVCRKEKLWTEAGRRELEGLALGRWAARRRRDLLKWFDRSEEQLVELDRAVIEEAKRRPEATHLMKCPGVGPVTALAFVLTLGPVERFPRSKQIVSYLGLNPREYSSGGHQRLGSISKQGNSMMRFLLVEAAHTAVRFDSELRRRYQRLKHRRGGSVAKVAIARKLAVKLYWMLRELTEPDRMHLAPMQGSPVSALVDESSSSL
jgi:transposase